MPASHAAICGFEQLDLALRGWPDRPRAREVEIVAVDDARNAEAQPHAVIERLLRSPRRKIRLDEQRGIASAAGRHERVVEHPAGGHESLQPAATTSPCVAPGSAAPIIASIIREPTLAALRNSAISAGDFGHAQRP
jgi:hypothetical protein